MNWRIRLPSVEVGEKRLKFGGGKGVWGGRKSKGIGDRNSSDVECKMFCLVWQSLQCGNVGKPGASPEGS